jgi:transposase-like protein
MDVTTRSRVAREEWARRVERWRDSGLSCAEFAAELGINPRTLTYWRYILRKEARGEKRTWPRRKLAGGAASKTHRVPAAATVAAPFVEVQAVTRLSQFELELRGGRRLSVSRDFDATALRRLLEVLEAT